MGTSVSCGESADATEQLDIDNVSTVHGRIHYELRPRVPFHPHNGKPSASIRSCSCLSVHRSHEISLMKHGQALNSIQPEDKLSQDRLIRVFEHFDLDKDGYLDYNEVCCCARESVHLGCDRQSIEIINHDQHTVAAGDGVCRHSAQRATQNLQTLQ